MNDPLNDPAELQTRVMLRITRNVGVNRLNILLRLG